MRKHFDDIFSDIGLSNSDCLRLTETQFNLDEDASAITSKFWGNLAICFNPNGDKYKSIAVAYSVKIVPFYWSPNSPQSPFLLNFKFLIDEKRPNNLLEHFNINALCNSPCTRLNKVLVHYHLMVSEPTHLNGSLLLLDHMFVLKWFSRKKIINSVIKHYHFSDHDAVKLYIRFKLHNNTHDNNEFSIV